MSKRRPIALLSVGALLGLAAAAAGLLAQTRAASEIPDGAVAAVNGAAVRRADFERAVEALASDRRGAIDDADRRHVLDRLVDEELLVQRAIELGLVRQDRRVRGDLVTAVIESVTADAGQREPSADHQPAADVTLSAWARARAALLLGLVVTGLAALIGILASIVIVGLVLLVT